MKFVVGGQIEKDTIEKKLIALTEGQDVSISVMPDIEAAMALKSGQVDYYFGACNTGGGGALAMAIAIAGADKCGTIGMPGKLLPDDEIIAMVKSGKAAFGFTGQDTDRVLPVLVTAILAKG